VPLEDEEEVFGLVGAEVVLEEVHRRYLALQLSGENREAVSVFGCAV
jgi:hypothetical protein